MITTGAAVGCRSAVAEGREILCFVPIATVFTSNHQPAASQSTSIKTQHNLLPPLGCRISKQSLEDCLFHQGYPDTTAEVRLNGQQTQGNIIQSIFLGQSLRRSQRDGEHVKFEDTKKTRLPSCNAASESEVLPSTAQK